MHRLLWRDWQTLWLPPPAQSSKGGGLLIITPESRLSKRGLPNWPLAEVPKGHGVE